ncbi:hypothetical protein predicted by Glimmer/Critica [Erwinia amylovora CFBP1430]|uniref:Uncharacterized protein n=2 Tax=Erwinia amylovora TaxID=552 RepID=D4I3J0_ERWAC|nr:hypothetical protein predicted by Glimmer/Critica [Erwinia amylovora CFBP1430]CBX82362.1 hypothetical protein predicted by Glimmer/Critica [Erwinia amylovora ATCC BAA-2158]
MFPARYDFALAGKDASLLAGKVYYIGCGCVFLIKKIPSFLKLFFP